MTSRSVRQPDSPPAGPGDRPHLPPVQQTRRRTDRRTPLGWLPWLLLGLLLLTLLGSALLARAAGGSSDTAARGSDRAASASPEGAGAAAGTSSGNAALSAGGQDLLAVEGGRIGTLAGQQASGTAQVESVVADEGFWVGADAARRVFVFLTPEARRSAGESGFQVEAGQTVSLEGTVKASSPEFAQSAGVTDAEGSAQLVEQGGYVEATQVRLAS